MLSLTFKKPTAVKMQDSVILVSFTANVLPGADNNPKHYLLSTLSLKINF